MHPPAELRVWSGHLDRLEAWCQEPWTDPPRPPAGQLPAELADRARQVLDRLESRRRVIDGELAALRSEPLAPRRSTLRAPRFTLEFDA
jgi:hypothetical protein